MPGGRLGRLPVTLSSFGLERRRLFGQQQQAPEKLLVREAVEIVDVEIQIFGQQGGDHLQIGVRLFLPNLLNHRRAGRSSQLERRAERRYASSFNASVGV